MSTEPITPPAPEELDRIIATIAKNRETWKGSPNYARFLDVELYCLRAAKHSQPDNTYAIGGPADQGEAARADRLRACDAVTVEDDWRDDPSADERWNAGCDYAMVQLCAVLGVDPKDVRWDAATETLDGDVCAAISNVFRVKYGEDWDADGPPAPPQAPGEQK